MKNKKLNTLLVTLLTPILLTGCTSNNIQLASKATEAQWTATKLVEYINSMNKGFRMNGVVTQSRTLLDEDGNEAKDPNTNEVIKESQDYKVIATYENDERVGTSVLHQGQLGNIVTTIDNYSYFMDEEGYAYEEYLDSRNVVQRKYIKDDDNKLSFNAAGLYNFSGIFNYDDIKPSEVKNVYNVDINKTSIIVKNLLARVNTGFFYTPKSSIITTTEDGLLDEFKIVMEDFIRNDMDNKGNIQTTKYSNEVTFTFENINNAKLYRVTPYLEKPQNYELYNALNEIKDNFTLDVESNISVNNQPSSTLYRTFKANGSEILVQDYNDISERDVLSKRNHFILRTLEGSLSDTLYSYVQDLQSNSYVKRLTSGFSGNYQGIYTYEDLMPEAKDVSINFFNYDQASHEYVCSDRVIVDEINTCFTIGKQPLVERNILNAGKIGIRLTPKGKLDYVKYYINNKDVFSGAYSEGEVKVTYRDIGETTF